jgi:maltose O-acetyltransferase
MGVRVLKGVTIGADSVIGAGSVVTSSIPAGVIAAGNPARPVLEL